jgi:hypothetical protein
MGQHRRASGAQMRSHRSPGRTHVTGFQRGQDPHVLVVGPAYFLPAFDADRFRA